MKKKLRTLIKYRLVGFLVLLSTLVWGQTNNRKYLTKNHPEKVLKGTHEPIGSLSIHPAAKALLERAHTKETSTNKNQTSLGKVLKGPSLQLPTTPKKNSLKQTYPIELIIHNDQHNLPIFIKGKQNQFLTTRKTTSRSIDYVAEATNFLTEYKDLLQIKNPTTEFKEKEIISDKQGNTHIKLQQYWNDIPIWNSEVIVHATTKGVYSFGGNYHPSPTLAATPPNITAPEAVSIAKQSLGEENCIFSEKWRDIIPPAERQTSELIYHIADNDIKPQLAWKVEVRTTNLDNWLFIVDAIDGNIIDQMNQVCSFNGPTTAIARDLHGVNRRIHTYDNGSIHYLVDGSRPMFNPNSTVPRGEQGAIITYTGDFNLPEERLFFYLVSEDNTWSNAGSVSAHYHAGIGYEYFLEKFNRNSIDNQGGNIYSIIDSELRDNAIWTGREMIYGYGDNIFNPESTAKSLDICTHEMAHGVIQNSAGLIYRTQSGALNESFADIFGVMVDRDDWTIGEDIVNPTRFRNGSMRNFANPNNNVAQDQLGWQPKHMSEYEFHPENRDAGGVHTNSGIPNHAFYLFAITPGIGKDRAEQVYYKALTERLRPRSQFIECRLEVIEAARELYGTAAANAAANAFDQVGIYGAFATVPTEELPSVQGSGYLLTQTPYQGETVIAELDFTQNTYRVKSNHEFQPRLSVFEGGAVALFIGDDRKAYVLDLTNDDPTTNTELLLTDETLQWTKVAISRNNQNIAFLRYPLEPKIVFLNLATNTVSEFDIYTPITGTEGTPSAPEYLDIIQFDPTGEYIIYDAYNDLGNSDSFWDIGIIKVWNNATNSLADGFIWKPFTQIPSGYSIGNPIFANNSFSRIAYEVFNGQEGVGQVIIQDLYTRKYAVAATYDFKSDYSLLGFPCFSPNDTYLAYVTDKGENQNYITFQKLQQDKISPLGTNVSKYYGEFPMWYARGQRNFNEPIAGFVANNPSGKAPLTVSFKDRCTNNPLLWSWTFEGGTPSISYARNPIVTYNQPGTYQVQLRVANDAGEDQLVRNDYIEVLNSTDSNCENTLNLTSNSTESASYKAARTITSATYIRSPLTITYQAGQSITLNAGFHATAGANFHAYIEDCSAGLLSDPTASIFTPNTLTTTRTTAQNLTIVPNPAQVAATVQYELAISSTVQIDLYDLMGKKIMPLVQPTSIMAGKYQHSIEVANLQKGIYLVVLTTTEGVIAKKMVVN